MGVEGAAVGVCACVRESRNSEIAAAHYPHLYLSDCSTSNYCRHIAPNSAQQVECGGRWISLPRFCAFCSRVRACAEIIALL